MKTYKRSKERSFADEAILYVCFVGFLVLIVGMAWFFVGQECETIYNQSLGILVFQVGIIIKSNNGHAR